MISIARIRIVPRVRRSMSFPTRNIGAARTGRKRGLRRGPGGRHRSHPPRDVAAPDRPA
jgi:hypothetical protein